MKVISGILKGRNIMGYDIDGTRPTMDRVKESVFGMIQDYLKDSIVLDLFAGSGQLGIEAISNGAKKCYFNDHNRDVIKVLETNIKNLNIEDKSIILLSDWKKTLNSFNDNNTKFDLIFIDPPYDYDVYDKILFKISHDNLINNQGLVIVEYQNFKLQDCYENLKLYKSKKYGNKIVNIYKKD